MATDAPAPPAHAFWSSEWFSKWCGITHGSYTNNIAISDSPTSGACGFQHVLLNQWIHFTYLPWREFMDIIMLLMVHILLLALHFQLWDTTVSYMISTLPVSSYLSPATHIYSKGTLADGASSSGYHGPIFGSDGMWSSVPWYDGTTFANGQQRPAAASSTSFVTSNVENNTSSRNQNLHISHSSHGVFQ
ncbi:hypothetical protein Cni_G16703 [Canna indica]|uniref:Uncharacterized protein n=1 Tax=Canna indica TaxID=4628 RepID=A0AAQ3KFK7_9LILI|nr:hypothetical protein Cni_G16703 [Canna indica]